MLPPQSQAEFKFHVKLWSCFVNSLASTGSACARLVPPALKAGRYESHQSKSAVKRKPQHWMESSHKHTDAHTQSDWFAASSSESQRSSLGVSYAEHDRHRLVEHYFIAGICSALLRSPFSFYLHCFSLSLLHPAFSRRRLSRHSFLFCTYVIYSLLFLILRRENPHNYFFGFAPPCVTPLLPYISYTH